MQLIADKAVSLSYSLPLVMTFTQLISLFPFAFLSLLCLAHAHNLEPSSYISPASSRIYRLHEQEEPSIAKSFIYETVAASSPPGSPFMHAKLPHNKKEAVLLDADAQDHTTKEQPSLAKPAYIYESVAALFSSKPPSEGSHLHDNAPPHKADAALSDNGWNHVRFEAKPSFIYESVAASLPPKADGSNILREHSQKRKEEKTHFLDDGIGKPIMKKEVAKPLFIYESVMAASIPSKASNDGSLLRSNVPQEENAFLLDDGSTHPFMQKKDGPTISTPSFIYESVAASFHPDVRDAIRSNVPQEENAFLLDDGGKHVDSVEKEPKPITAKPFIYESVAASIRPEVHDALHSNVAQEENAFLLDDGNKHVDNVKTERMPITDKPFIYESLAASIHSEVHDPTRNNVPQEENTFFVDDGGKHVDNVKKEHKPITEKPFIYESVEVRDALRNDVPQEEKAFFLDDGGKHVDSVKKKPLQDNVPQENYAFLDDDGDEKPISSTHDDDNNNKWIIDIKPKEVKAQSLHEINVTKSLNVQEDNSPATAPASLLDVNGPQGSHVFLVDDGGSGHTKQNSPIASSKEVELLLHDNVPQDQKHFFLVDDGGKHARHKSFQSSKEEEHVLHDAASQGEYSSPLGVGEKKELHSTKPLKGKDVNIKNQKKLPIYHKLHLAKDKFNEENLRMVMDGSSKDMQLKKGQQANGMDDVNSNEDNFKTMEEDSSNKKIHATHPVTDIRKGDPQEENLRMVVGDSSNSMTHKGAAACDMEGDCLNGKNTRVVVGDSTSNMTEKGHDIKGNCNVEENPRIVVGDSSSKMVHKGEGSVCIKDNQQIQNEFEAEDYPANEESLKMVVGDSSNNMIQTGYEVQRNYPGSSEVSLRMVVGDSSKSMVQEGHGNSLKEDNLRMVVDDISNNMIKKGPFRTHGRSRSCTSNPYVCHQLAHAEHINHIALYGQLPPTTLKKKPACCGGGCTDLNTNLQNCGGCGKACGLSQTCCNGKCTDLNRDDLNCGQCGHTCPSFSPCQYGMCGYY